MTALLCAFASGAGFYFSTDLGTFWPLAWLAPIPVLWLAFGPARGWTAFLAAWAAGVIGGLNLLPAYAGTLPASVLVLAILGPGLYFAASVMGARLVARRLSPLAGMVAFAALWTMFDYLAAQGPNGAALSPAYSQVGMPFLIQGASVFGLWIVTFAIGFFAAGGAMALATKRSVPAILAIALVLANAGYGTWRIVTAPKTPVVHVGLGADDALADASFKADEKTALGAVAAYADAARTLAAQGASLIVFPEKVAILEPEWREAAKAELVTVAHVTQTMIVIGFDDRGTERQNNALIFFGNGTSPQLYTKRRLVPGLESAFVPGQASYMLSSRTAVAICKDMDFPAMLRTDARLHPTLFAVPAWDFGKDRRWHARLAIMRGVENGFAVARSAKEGLLTLSDAYGHVIAEKSSESGGMVTLVGDLPRGLGATLYARVGDAFAWICAGLSLLLLGAALLAPRRP